MPSSARGLHDEPPGPRGDELGTRTSDETPTEEKVAATG
jgi:hypothetical protein